MAKARKKTSKSKGSSDDLYRRIRKQYEKSSSGSRYWRPKKGKNCIRVIPFEHDGREEVFVEEVHHYNVVPGGGRVICIGPECPICEMRDDLEDGVWNRISPSRKFLFNAVLRGSNGDEDKLVIASVGASVYKKLVQYITDQELVKKALDPKRGRDFYITRTGEQLKTSYDVLPAGEPSPIGIPVKPTDLIDMLARRDQPSKEDLEKYAASL